MTGISFVDAILALIMAVCSLFTGFINNGVTETSPEAVLVKEEQVILTDSVFSGQGIATDGKYYYTSGSLTAFDISGLAKFDAETMECVVKNTDAIPSQCKKDYDSNHIGGIDYYNGLLYTAVEDPADANPLVVTYDARTLKAKDVYEMPVELLDTGIPWCAVDEENGYLYCSNFRDVTGIYAFDLETMEYSHTIGLSEEITRIQGGDVYEGVLYLSSDSKEGDDYVYAIDVLTGKVTLLFSRTLPSMAGNEAEGMAVYPMPDGSMFHVIDYDKTIGVFLRHYKLS